MTCRKAFAVDLAAFLVAREDVGDPVRAMALLDVPVSVRGRSGCARLARAALVLVLIALAACGADDDGDFRPGCAAGCTLAEAATQAGVWMGAAIDSPPSSAAAAVIPLHFNSVTAENAMKWGSVAPTAGNYDFTAADAIVNFAAARGVRVRGHTLVWRTQQPSDLRAEVLGASDPAARMRELLAEHVGTVVGRYRGRVAVWDVVNEPLAVLGPQLDRNLFMHTLGESYLDMAFERARAADPEARLFLNEFFYVHSDADDRVRGFHELVRRLLGRGVPVDGVGIQAHFFGVVAEPPERAALERMLRSFTDLGVVVELTELDISINYFAGMPDPLARQARAYADVTAACMAVPGCQAVTTWGVDDATTWLDTIPPFNASAPHLPLLFDGNLTPKPAYYAVRDAIARRVAALR